jgi:hypothetical protein
MRDRREQILKFICLALAATLTFQLARFVVRGNPTKALVIPALPSLPPEADSKATNSANVKASGQKGTNTPASEATVKTGTNTQGSEVRGQRSEGGSNAVVAAGEKKESSAGEHAAKEISEGRGQKSGGSNSLSVATEKKQAKDLTATNAAGKKMTNSATEHSTESKPTNAVLALVSPKNSGNAPGTIAGPKSGTNAIAGKASAMTNAPPGGRPGMPGKPPEPPPEIKERVDRVTQGEILAPVIRPMPMALLGIAGQNAFLRSAEGQTGMIKEGDQLGTIKLLRIGTNRVLIEHEGEKKELTIFAGLGSETLLPPKPKLTNETTKKSP